MAFGEGMGPVIADDKLLLVFDHEGESFMVALDKATGKEIWRVGPRREDQLGRAAGRRLQGTQAGHRERGTTKVRSYDLETAR